MQEPSPAPRRTARDYARDGWELGGAALALARRDGELRKFAAAAYACVVAIEVADAIPAIALHRNGTIAEYAGYLVLSAYVVALFSNLAAVGLAGLANGVLDGQPIRRSDGWRLMVRRAPQVAGWALLVVAVGIPARVLTGWGLDQFAAVLLGFGWAVLSFFAIPAMAISGDGPVHAGMRSLGLVGRQWGTQMVGMAYVWLRPIVFVGLPGFLVAAAGVLAILEGHDFLGWTIASAGVVTMAFTYLLIVTANSLLSVALFRFAQGDPLPPEFDAQMLERVLHPPAARTRRIVSRLDFKAARAMRERVERLVEDWRER